MSAILSTRRDFLKSAGRVAGAAVAAGWLPPRAGSAAGAESAAESAGAKPRAIRLGGPVFSAPKDPEELALAHRKLGYRAAYCPAWA